jgi:hypothetical protein
MVVLTFAQLVAHAVATGMGEVGPQATQLDQILLAVNAQEARMAASQPALDTEINGCGVGMGAVTGWALEDGYATPLTVHAGYSEGGAYVLHGSQLLFLDTMGNVPASPEVWALFQSSVWGAAA